MTDFNAGLMNGLSASGYGILSAALGYSALKDTARALLGEESFTERFEYLKEAYNQEDLTIMGRIQKVSQALFGQASVISTNRLTPLASATLKGAIAWYAFEQTRESFASTSGSEEKDSFYNKFCRSYETPQERLQDLPSIEPQNGVWNKAVTVHRLFDGSDSWPLSIKTDYCRYLFTMFSSKDQIPPADQIEPSYDFSELKQGYRNLSKDLHPDRFQHLDRASVPNYFNPFLRGNQSLTDLAQNLQMQVNDCNEKLSLK